MDRKKVIKGLKCCTGQAPSVCLRCPYRHTPDKYPLCNEELCTEALALIEEQHKELVKLQRSKNRAPRNKEADDER